MSHPSKRIRTGLVITALVAVFLAFNTLVKLLGLPMAVDATVQLGYPSSAVIVVGTIQALCLVLYLTPRTSALGALLLTGSGRSGSPARCALDTSCSASCCSRSMLAC